MTGYQKKAIGSTMLAAHSNRSNYLILYIIKNVYWWLDHHCDK